MIIEISDSSKYKRIDAIKIQLTIIAASVSEDHNEMSEFIGISRRTLSTWINKYEELSKFKQIKPEAKNSYWNDGPLWKKVER